MLQPRFFLAFEWLLLTSHTNSDVFLFSFLESEEMVSNLSTLPFSIFFFAGPLLKGL